MFFLVKPQYFLIGMLLAIAIVFFVHSVRTQLGQNLAKKIVKMGNLAGKSYKEFCDALGMPYAVKQAQIDTDKIGKKVTWRAGRYETVIMFNQDDIIDHIVSETIL